MKIRNALIAAGASMLILAQCLQADAARGAPTEQQTPMLGTSIEAVAPVRLAQAVNKPAAPGVLPDGRNTATPKPEMRDPSKKSKNAAPHTPRVGDSAVSTNCARANVKCRQTCFNTHCGPGTEGNSTVNFCAGTVPTPPAVNYLSCLGRCNTALKACKSGHQKQR